MTEHGTKPWDRQFGETSRQYEAFATYRDLGPHRSIDAAFRRLYESAGRLTDRRGTPITQRRAPRAWFEWSGANDWVNRVAAYDFHLDRLALQSREDALLRKTREAMEHEYQQHREWRKRNGLPVGARL